MVRVTDHLAPKVDLPFEVPGHARRNDCQPHDLPVIVPASYLS
jgi:hypothetical protein